VLYFPPYLQHVATLPCGKHNIKKRKISTHLMQYHFFVLLLTKLTKHILIVCELVID